MQGEIDDETAVARMAATYASLIEAWDRVRPELASSNTRPTAHAVPRE
jgi:myo-inositol catabolism protein IolC